MSLMSLTSLMIVCVHVSMHTCMYLYYNKVNQIYDRYSGSQCVAAKVIAPGHQHSSAGLP